MRYGRAIGRRAFQRENLRPDPMDTQVSLLGAHGLAPERALIFSVCFGLVGVIAVLPGLIVWLLYPAATPFRRAVIAVHSRHSSICCGRWRGSSVPLTSITRPRPPRSRRLISGQPAAR